MASFQGSSGGPFHASDLAKWFHSAPHKDLQLEDTTTIFSPAEKTYREALYVLAICIASFGVLLFLVLVIFYSCCYCICRRKKEQRDQNESCHCSKFCLKMQVFIVALICCGALVAGFIYNGKTSDGVDQFRNSVDVIQSDINYASTMGKEMRKTLQQSRDNINELMDESGSTAAKEASNLSNIMIYSLDAVNQLLPQHIVNKSSVVGDKVHRYDNYRWLTTVILLSWCIFLCIFLFWIGCQINGCVLVMTTMFCLLTILFTWAVTGADFAIATGIGDFCVHPRQAILKEGYVTPIVISYYMDCTGHHNPFQNGLNELQSTLKTVIKLINEVPRFEGLKRIILGDLNNVHDTLPIYEASFTCDKIHEEYMSAMDGLCENTLNSLAIVILAVFVIAIFSGLLTCCVCPLWKHRHPHPTTYNDIRNSPDDIGNAVLWWPHDVDAESNQSFYQRHTDPTEQSPLIANQHHPGNYETGNQQNVNVIHVDYHPEPIRSDEPQSSIRHSF